MARVARFVLGWTLVVAGGVGLFLPLIQGTLLIATGLFVLARDSERIRAFIARIRSRWPVLDHAIARVTRRAK